MTAHSSPKSAIVVGGGVIGLLTAYYLRRGGIDVTVLERDRVGHGCSWGNLGWICPSISTPLPAPGLGVTGLRSFLDPDSPLYIRPGRLPRLAPFLFRFWRYCNERDFAAGCAALAGLNGETMRLYDELEADGVEFEYMKTGLTFVAADAAALDEELEAIETVGAARAVRWSPAELRAHEPSLPEVFAGALHVSTDRNARGDSVCTGVAARLRERGARIEEGFDVRSVRVGPGGRAVVEGPRGAVDADAVVLATGAEAGRHAVALGRPLPIQAGKGYTFSVYEPRIELESPLYLLDAHIGLTPYKGMLRIGGTMELSGVNREIDRRRLETIRRVVSRLLPEAFEGGRVREWVGLRPLTPDGLPVIGPLPGIDNVYVASGHQMLGVTLAPATGHALAGLILEGQAGLDLAPFDPARFA